MEQPIIYTTTEISGSKLTSRKLFKQLFLITDKKTKQIGKQFSAETKSKYKQKIKTSLTFFYRLSKQPRFF